MGCNTSKESSTAPSEDEKKVEDVREEDLNNHVESDSKDTKSSSAKTITIRANGRASVDNSNQEEAATKIQAVFRGHKTRKSMKQPAQSQDEREPTREELENEFRLDDAELCNAATKIQASFRGHMSRKNLEKPEVGGSDNNKAEEELDIDLTDPDLNKAAAKIQASFRGHLTRKDGDNAGN